jgi:hypothetical protein
MGTGSTGFVGTADNYAAAVGSNSQYDCYWWFADSEPSGSPHAPSSTTDWDFWFLYVAKASGIVDDEDPGQVPGTNLGWGYHGVMNVPGLQGNLHGSGGGFGFTSQVDANGSYLMVDVYEMGFTGIAHLPNTNIAALGAPDVSPAGGVDNATFVTTTGGEVLIPEYHTCLVRVRSSTGGDEFWCKIAAGGSAGSGNMQIRQYVVIANPYQVAIYAEGFGWPSGQCMLFAGMIDVQTHGADYPTANAVVAASQIYDISTAYTTGPFGSDNADANSDTGIVRNSVNWPQAFAAAINGPLVLNPWNSYPGGVGYRGVGFIGRGLNFNRPLKGLNGLPVASTPYVLAAAPNSTSQARIIGVLRDAMCVASGYGNSGSATPNRTGLVDPTWVRVQNFNGHTWRMFIDGNNQWVGPCLSVWLCD